MKEDYFKKATDPHQYDAGVVTYQEEGLDHSPTRRFFNEYLKKFLDVKGKKVLDIGSGMGQLFPLLQELEASSVIGLEPSVHNISVCRKYYPEMPIIQGTLESVEITDRFEAAVAVMVFGHIADIQVAFSKIHTFLKEKGIFYLIVSNKTYQLTPRFNYKLDIFCQDDIVSVVKVTRPWGVLYDIIRPVEYEIDMGKKNGFILKEKIDMVPTEYFLTVKPEYKVFANTPIAHLLIFEKK